MSEVAQYIKFGELTAPEAPIVNGIDSAPPRSADAPVREIEPFPEGVESGTGVELTRDEEDAILRDTSGTFADWVAAFLRRVILLFENLPEEGPNGAAGGATEGQQQ